jgi:hypothetical protein
MPILPVLAQLGSQEILFDCLTCRAARITELAANPPIESIVNRLRAVDWLASSSIERMFVTETKWNLVADAVCDSVHGIMQIPKIYQFHVWLRTHFAVGIPACKRTQDRDRA